MNQVCSCIVCKKEVSYKGIRTHVMRTHEKIGFKGSTGYNGRYNDIEYKATVEKANKKKALDRCGPIKEFVVSCFKCNTSLHVLEREKKFPAKEKYFCSRSCANSHVVTEEHKKKTSESLTGLPYEPVTEVVKTCICGKEFETTNKQTRKYCSASCATKYCPTHVEKRKQAREKRPALINYRKDCAFKFNLADYPVEFDFKLIEQYGWYSAKNRGNNLTGVSRDHLVSVRYGFDNNIPSEHLAHPANCALLRHGENVSKGIKNSITYEQLLKRIAEWDNKYPRIVRD
jgi:hypothetical protein